MVGCIIQPRPDDSRNIQGLWCDSTVEKICFSITADSVYTYFGNGARHQDYYYLQKNQFITGDLFSDVDFVSWTKTGDSLNFVSVKFFIRTGKVKGI